MKTFIDGVCRSLELYLSKAGWFAHQSTSRQLELSIWISDDDWKVRENLGMTNSASFCYWSQSCKPLILMFGNFSSIWAQCLHHSCRNSWGSANLILRLWELFGAFVYRILESKPFSRAVLLSSFSQIQEVFPILSEQQMYCHLSSSFRVVQFRRWLEVSHQRNQSSIWLLFVSR